MFEVTDQIAAHDDATDRHGLRRVAWAELAAAISLSRSLREDDRGLLAKVGSFDSHEAKEERGINLSSLASRNAPVGRDVLSTDPAPRRHREKR